MYSSMPRDCFWKCIMGKKVKSGHHTLWRCEIERESIRLPRLHSWVEAALVWVCAEPELKRGLLRDITAVYQWGGGPASPACLNKCWASPGVYSGTDHASLNLFLRHCCLIDRQDGLECFRPPWRDDSRTHCDLKVFFCWPPLELITYSQT